MGRPDSEIDDDWLPRDPELAAMLRAVRALAAERRADEEGSARDAGAPAGPAPGGPGDAFDRLRGELRQADREERTGLGRLWRKLTGRGRAGRA